MIRKALAEDLAAIEASYTELLIHEQECGSNTNWVLGVYPTRTTCQQALSEDTLYVLEENGEICGSVILNHKQPEIYREIMWKYPGEGDEILLIHTLCIPPSKTGCGYGRKLVAFSLELAQKLGCKAMRLDTYEGNKPAAALYRKLEFRFAGSGQTLHEGVIPETLIFFEKEI